MSPEKESVFSQVNSSGVDRHAAGGGFRVEAMFKRFTVKEAANLAGGDPRSFLGGLLAGARNVRRHHDVRSSQQARVRRDRLLRKHIEAGTPEVAALERVANRVVVDKCAARAIDEHRPGRHHGELLRADHAVGFGCGPSMQGNNARASKQFVESDALHEITEGLRLRVRIIHEHMTPEAAKYPGDAGADRTEADQSGDGILELEATLIVVVVIPAPVALL